jgi:long-chain acyl-CoA synthetase
MMAQPMSTCPATLPALFAARVADSADRPGLFVRREQRYVGITWRELAETVRSCAAGLIERGVRPGDRVAQFSENRYEWLVVDLAIQLAQAIHVPIHAPLTGEQAAYQIDHSGAVVLFVSTSAQAAKLAGLPRDWPSTLHCFRFDPEPMELGGRPVPSWETLHASNGAGRGEEVERQAVERVRPESLATILYTSGTTGEPKGVMLSHHNLVSNAWGAVTKFGMSGGDRRLNFLPLSHIFARTCDAYTWLITGCELGLAQNRETVLADCADFHPTIMSGVPYFYDRVRRLLLSEGRESEPGALRDKLGGAISYCCSGGAPLPDHVYDFYWEREVPLLQGYGLTETSPVISMSTMEHVRRGASGVAIRDVEVRIAEDGEILTRGPHVMLGYYQRPEATAEVLRDGWFSTGDYGRVDEDGFLFITGRKKELIVTSGGKNIAPVQLESLLTEDPLILQAVVIGDGRDYLTALIVPNPDALRDEIVRRQIPVTSRAEALKHPQVLALYEERIRERLRSVSYYEQVKKFCLMDRGFTIESGELTPKLSLRRQEIALHCCDLIEDLYRKN